MLYKHTFSYFISKGVPAIIAFASLLIYTRLLSPAEYANYSLTVLFVALMNGVVFQWIRFGVSRFLLEYDQLNQTTLVDNVFRIYFSIFKVVIGCALAASIYFHTTGQAYWGNVALLAAVLLCCQCTYDLISQIFISRLKPEKFAFTNILKGALSFTCSITLLFLGFNAQGILIGLIIGHVIPVLLNIRQLSNNFAFLQLKVFDYKIIRQLKLYGLPLALSLCFNFFLSYSDRYMIAWLVDKQAAGKFSLGVDITEQSLALLMGIISTPTFPIAISYFERKEYSLFNNHMSASLSLLCSVAIPAAVGLSVLSKDIILVIFGKEFADINIYLIPIIASSVLILGIKSYYFDIAFYLNKKTKEQFLILFPSIILCLILNYFLIPRWGYMGGAISTLISYVFASATTIFRTNKILKLPFPVKNILMIFVSATTMGIVILSISLDHTWINLGIKIVIGGLTYATMLILLNYMNIRQILKHKLPAFLNRITPKQ